MTHSIAVQSLLPLTQGQWRACLFANKHGGSFSVVASTDTGSVESLKRESRRHTFSNYPCFPEEISFTALPSRGEKPSFKDGVLQIFVAPVDNLSSLSGLDLPTGHSPTLERVGYCRASQGDEEPQPDPLTMATFCLHKSYVKPLFSGRQLLTSSPTLERLSFTHILVRLNRHPLCKAGVNRGRSKSFAIQALHRICDP